MPSFKLTIAVGTPLWDALGTLPAKARNAEIYRLATTALLANQNANGRITEEKQTKAEAVYQETKTETPSPNTSNFIAVDFSDDLAMMFSTKKVE